jgi:hypothetical protein
MVMVKELANSPPCAHGDFACSLGHAHAHILARNRRAFSHIPGGVNGVQGDQIARAFSHSLGCRAGTLGRPFADIARTAAHLAPGAVFLILSVAFSLGLGLRLRLRLGGLLRLRLRRLLSWRLGCPGRLAVLAGGLQSAKGQGQREKCDGW